MFCFPSVSQFSSPGRDPRVAPATVPTFRDDPHRQRRRGRRLGRFLRAHIREKCLPGVPIGAIPRRQSRTRGITRRGVRGDQILDEDASEEEGGPRYTARTEKSLILSNIETARRLAKDSGRAGDSWSNRNRGEHSTSSTTSNSSKRSSRSSSRSSRPIDDVAAKIGNYFYTSATIIRLDGPIVMLSRVDDDMCATARSYDVVATCQCGCQRGVSGNATIGGWGRGRKGGRRTEDERKMRGREEGRQLGERKARGRREGSSTLVRMAVEPAFHPGLFLFFFFLRTG